MKIKKLKYLGKQCAVHNIIIKYIEYKRNII